MSKNQREGIESLLRTFSVVSDREDNWLPGAIMRVKTEEIHLNPVKLKQFLDRFSNEKAFGDVILEAMSTGKTTKENIVTNACISEEILEKVLTNTLLPNVIPLKKMIYLLNFLHIPLSVAVESLRVSLNRFNVEKSLEAVYGVSMRQKRMAPFRSGTVRRSKEALKRSLEVYIKRLLEETK